MVLTFVASFVVLIHAGKDFFQQPKQCRIIPAQLLSCVYVVVDTVRGSGIRIYVEETLHTLPKILLYRAHCVGIPPQASSLCIAVSCLKPPHVTRNSSTLDRYLLKYTHTKKSSIIILTGLSGPVAFHQHGSPSNDDNFLVSMNILLFYNHNITQLHWII